MLCCLVCLHIFSISLKQHSAGKHMHVIYTAEVFFLFWNERDTIHRNHLILFTKNTKETDKKEMWKSNEKLNDNDVSTKSTTRNVGCRIKLLDLNITNIKNHRLCFIFIRNWKWLRQPKCRNIDTVHHLIAANSRNREIYISHADFSVCVVVKFCCLAKCAVQSINVEIGSKKP